MILTYYRMTSDELYRIFTEAKRKNRKLTKDDFAERIGVGRTKLYDYFKGVAIEPGDSKNIEARIIGDPELRGFSTLMEVTDKRTELPAKSTTVATAGQTNSPELWEKALNMLNDTLQLLKGTIDTVRDDNKFIKEDATIYRDVVKQGIQNGALVWHKPKKSA
jgi:transcriptional regulator with XRE-family HTH domain